MDDASMTEVLVPADEFPTHWYDPAGRLQSGHDEQGPARKIALDRHEQVSEQEGRG